MHQLNGIVFYFETYPYLVVLFAFVLLLFLFPLPEELILFTGGYLAFQEGGIIWLPTLVAGIVGMVSTDYWFFWIFKRWGHTILRTKIAQRIFTEKRLRSVSDLVQRKGPWGIFVVRFIPSGIRTPTFAIAGMTGLSRKKFLLASVSGAIIVSQITFWSGYFLSEVLPDPEDLLKMVTTHIRTIILVVILVFLARRLVTGVLRRKF